jgi:hypothetical protein
MCDRYSHGFLRYADQPQSLIMAIGPQKSTKDISSVSVTWHRVAGHYMSDEATSGHVFQNIGKSDADLIARA